MTVLDFIEIDKPRKFGWADWSPTRRNLLAVSFKKEGNIDVYTARVDEFGKWQLD